jgi:hypothetical protein
VPVWNRLRYSEKLMAPLTLCACALGAMGIDAFAAARLGRPWRLALATAAVVAGASLALLVAAPDATARVAARLLGPSGSFYRSTLAAGLPHLVLSLGALLAIDRLRRVESRRLGLAVAVALASASAAYYGAHLGSRAPQRYVTSLPLASDSPVPRIAQPAAGAYDARRLKDFVEWTAHVEAAILDPAINVAHRVDTILTYGAFSPRRITMLSAEYGTAWAKLYRRFGLTHVVLPIPRDTRSPDVVKDALDGAELVVSSPELGQELWAVPHRPWAFFAEGAVASARPEEALRSLIGLSVLGKTLTTVIETSAPLETAPGNILKFTRGAEEVLVEAQSEGPALLVVQDSFWPGWRATIDGQPTEILAADYLVRALRWPSGRHTMTMFYDPPEIRRGLALSGLGILLLLALAAAEVLGRGETSRFK